MKEYIITINSHSHKVIVKKIQSENAVVEVNGKEFEVGIQRQYRRTMEPLEVRPTKPVKESPVPSLPARTSVSAAGKTINAPLPGLILKILVREGERITSNQTVVKMEAMKMENEIKSDKTGIIKKIWVTEGDAVLENTPLLTLEIA